MFAQMSARIFSNYIDAAARNFHYFNPARFHSALLTHHIRAMRHKLVLTPPIRSVYLGQLWNVCASIRGRAWM